jgi:hypothetical protein
VSQANLESNTEEETKDPFVQDLEAVAAFLKEA